MNLSQAVLRFFHPKAEQERVEYRKALARARAEAEDLNRTVSMDSERLQRWLAENVNADK